MPVTMEERTRMDKKGIISHPSKTMEDVKSNRKYQKIKFFEALLSMNPPADRLVITKFLCVMKKLRIGTEEPADKNDENIIGI